MGKKIDLTGQRFGKLTVLKEAEKRNDHGSVCWICRCDCGNQVTVSSDNLRRNHTQSCGCKKKEAAQQRVVDLTGKKFGKLTVIKKAKNPYKGRHICWECNCDCGTKGLIIDGENLKHGRTSSCGCLGNSKGEYVIKNLLTFHHISFEQEKSFDNCLYPDTQRKARFDFYLPKENILIEFDGFQHFYYTEYDWNTEENFLKTIEHDEFKNKWCKENNIILIRIPYTHLETLKIEDLLKNSRFKMEEKECLSKTSQELE